MPNVASLTCMPHIVQHSAVSINAAHVTRRNTVIVLTWKIDEMLTHSTHIFRQFVDDIYARADMPPHIVLLRRTGVGNNFARDPTRLTVRRVAFSPWEERGIAESRRQWAPLCSVHQHRAEVPVYVCRMHVATAVYLHPATSKPNCEFPRSLLMSRGTLQYIRQILQVHGKIYDRAVILLFCLEIRNILQQASVQMIVHVRINGIDERSTQTESKLQTK